MKGLLLFILFIIVDSVYAQLEGELGILDVTANSGINPETGVAWAEGDTYRLVFVTTTARDAVSTNITDYNTHVQNAADAAGLGAVSWYAIASTNTTDARDNTFTSSTDTDGAFFLMDGSQIVANNISDLWDGNVDTQIDLDENGDLRAKDTPIWTPWVGVWTGTTNDGTADGSLCLGASSLTIGLSRAELHFWEDRATVNDNTVDLPLYGMSEVLTVQTILPIDLVSFEAKTTTSRKVELSWQTATEYNNDFFVIERSQDGINWEVFETVDGAGNSTTILRYHAVDDFPFFGTSYYRLKQTDFNGQFSYSNIVTILLDIKNEIKIYPNPAIDKITVVGKESEIDDINIFNKFGQNLTHLVTFEKLGDLSLGIDISLLNNGLYWIRFKYTTSKIYKQSYD